VSPSAPGTPTPVRLPQFQGETFKQFINYVYTGKVRAKSAIVYSYDCISFVAKGGGGAKEAKPPLLAMLGLYVFAIIIYNGIFSKKF
jgi:hypothetical protein